MVYNLRNRNSQGRVVAPSSSSRRLNSNSTVLNPRRRRVYRDARSRGLILSAPPTKFHDITSRNVRHWVEYSHMPNVYRTEKYGEVFDADLQVYQREFDERVSEARVVESVSHLEVGYRTGVSIEGYPIGHLVYILQKHNIPLSGLFLSGVCVEFASILEVHGEEKHVRREALKVQIYDFPLDRIEVAFHNAGELDSDNIPTSLGDYLSIIQSDWGGSDVSTYFLSENCYIARRHFFGQDLYKTKFRSTRTGGLGNLITETHEASFSFDGQAYTVYIPNGSNQCFDDCVVEGYIRNSGGDCAYGANQELEIEMEWEDPIERLKRQILDIQIQIFEERVKKHCHGRTRVSNSDRIRYRKKINIGYTSKELAILGKIYESHNIMVHCYRHMKRDGFWDVCKVKNKGNSNSVHIHCFRMTDSGKIENNDVPVESNTAETSGMRHCILVYPYPNITRSRDEDRFRKAIEGVSIPFMDNIYKNTSYCEESDESMEKQVEFQLERYKKMKTDTLIFHAPSIARKWKDKVSGVNTYYVFVYDLETVTNKMDNQDIVYPPFRRPHIADDVEPMECQIPFSAQWAPVNLSDIGRYAVRKIRENMEPRVEPRPEVSYLIEGTNIEYHDILLQEVVTEYGNQQLGRCVDDMFYHIAEWIHERGGSIGYLYAHNGVGFDSYICLQFTQFQIKNILKTSRGILSLTIVVPLEEAGVSISLILRDTKVHIQGSLSNICKSFNVPESWRKLDFPIARINAKNCYIPKIMEAVLPYQENDVKCLGFIVKRLNEMIMMSEWDPAQCSVRPPITQFMTCMSMVKKSTLSHFLKTEGRVFCHAIDIPRLRHWLADATIGGRVTAYARTYIHKFFGMMMTAHEANDKFTLKRMHEMILRDRTGMQVLDVTSLYPTAQSQCPMPTGELYFANQEQCLSSIDSIHCDACESMFSLCAIHKGASCEQRPFIIILVKNCTPAKSTMLNYIGRKLTTDTKTKMGLLYSLESREEVNARYGKEVLREIECYSNVDLYWMKKQGYKFEVINGFGWKVSMTYNSFIEPAFQKRIEAKRNGNKVLSDFYKLNYNSAYGVTAQKDIAENGFIIELPEDLRNRSYEDEEVARFITASGGSHGNLNADEDLVGHIPLRNGQSYFMKEKKSHLHEFYSDPSPMQIGAAVLSWSRHIMNLIMFGLDVFGEITYTDTDSIAVSDRAISQYLEKIPGLIDNRSEAALGSLKNDHGENNGTEPRVVASFIGTKKVKMHITLNGEGELRIFNTFKGLNPISKHDGFEMNEEYVECVIAKALLEINEYGRMKDIEVNQWKRSLEFGISIGQHIQTSHEETYLSHSAGSIHMTNIDGNHIEWFVPYGHREMIWDAEERKQFYENKVFGRSYEGVARFIESMYPKRMEKKDTSSKYDLLFQ